MAESASRTTRRSGPCAASRSADGTGPSAAPIAEANGPRRSTHSSPPPSSTTSIPKPGSPMCSAGSMITPHRSSTNSCRGGGSGTTSTQPRPEDHLPAALLGCIPLLVVAFYFFLATRVAMAHEKYNVKLPATTGNSDFECIFRVHMNTLEWMPTFLVRLWLCANYLNDTAAAVLGLVWIGGRVLYFAGYSKA